MLNGCSNRLSAVAASVRQRHTVQGASFGDCELPFAQFALRTYATLVVRRGFAALPALRRKRRAPGNRRGLVSPWTTATCDGLSRCSSFSAPPRMSNRRVAAISLAIAGCSRLRKHPQTQRLRHQQPARARTQMITIMRPASAGAETTSQTTAHAASAARAHSVGHHRHHSRRVYSQRHRQFHSRPHHHLLRPRAQRISRMITPTRRACRGA